MIEITPEQDIQPYWELDLLCKARNLLYLTDGDTVFDGYDVLSRSVGSLVLRNGGQSEQNVHIFLDESPDGVLIRNVHTFCNEVKEREVTDSVALATGDTTTTLKMQLQYTGERDSKTKIRQPLHSPKAIVEAMAVGGEIMNDNDSSLWRNGLSNIIAVRHEQSSSKTSRTKTSSFISRLLGRS